MPNHEGLHMRYCQRFTQHRVVVEVNLSDREIVGRPPIGVHQEALGGVERIRPGGFGLHTVER
jgi:hypothetical protein